MYKLPILGTLSEAFRFFANNLLTISKYAVPMIAVVIGYSIVVQTFADTGSSRLGSGGIYSFFSYLSLGQAIIVIPGISFAIAVHRHFF